MHISYYTCETYAPMGTINVDDPTELYRYFLPYIIYQDQDGSYLLLNRYYKPAGMVTHGGDWVNYAACSQRFRVRGLAPEIAARVSVSGSPDTNWITLYDDGCRPQDNSKHLSEYLKRLKLFYDLVEIENMGSSSRIIGSAPNHQLTRSIETAAPSACGRCRSRFCRSP